MLCLVMYVKNNFPKSSFASGLIVRELDRALIILCIIDIVKKVINSLCKKPP